MVSNHSTRVLTPQKGKSEPKEKGYRRILNDDDYDSCSCSLGVPEGPGWERIGHIETYAKGHSFLLEGGPRETHLKNH